MLYAGLSLAALLWGALAGRPWLLFTPGITTLSQLIWGAGAGIALGLGVALLTKISLSRFAWSRDLYRWFAQVLGPLSRRDAFWLALLSSVGEELFFRGAMQPSLGIWITTAIFGLAHLPPRRRYLPWTASALILGLILGYITLWSTNLAGAILAHFLINFLNLGDVKNHASPHVKAFTGPATYEANSMGDHHETRDDNPAPGPPPLGPAEPGSGGPAEPR